MTATIEQFDRNVPIPGRGGGGGRGHWIWEMQPGDSRFEAAGDVSSYKLQCRLSSLAKYIRHTTGAKYATRQVTEDGVAGVRVWRVA